VTKVLIIAEHDGRTLNPSTAKCVRCAAAIGGEADVLVLGKGLSAVAEAAAKISGVRTVFLTEAAQLEAPLAANWAPEIVAAAADYSHVLGPSTTFGRDLMPRVAALLGVNQVSDLMEVDNATTFRRPIYAGNAVVRVQAPVGSTVVATVRIASWPAAEGGGDAAVSERATVTEPAAHTRWLGLKTEGGERADLQSARVVVSGGRALASADNFKLIYALADKLKAGVGASRAAVDAGYVPNDMQVGQTGKIIAPELYMAFGISGAIQHVTGIKDAGTIVAVNKDPDAPIFEIADIGLVGDLFTILPELTDLLD